MMLDCLNNHPELYGFRAETRVIPYFATKLGSYGNLGIDENFRKLWDDFRHTPIFVSCNDGTPPPVPEDWTTYDRSFNSVVNGVFRYFASLDSKVRWCEKTPMHALHIKTLATIFPNSKFIHMIRDGRECAVSFHRRWGYNPYRTICRWKELIISAQSQGKKLPGRYMEIRYEDLTAEPNLHMTKICKFLEIEYTPELLSLSRNRKYSGSDAKEISPSVLKWPNYFNYRQILSLEKIGGKCLSGLRYRTENATGDLNPGHVKRTYWAFLDYSRAAINESKHDYSHTKYNYRAKVTAALKQLFTNYLAKLRK